LCGETAIAQGRAVSAAWTGLGWIDSILAVLVLVSAGVGLARGLVYELMGIAGWVVAYFGGAWLAPLAAPWIPVGTPGSALNHSAALLLCFLGTLIVWGLLARVARWLVSATPASLADRVLGGVFGLLRAVVLAMAVGTVVMLTPAAQSPLWQASVAVPWVVAAVKGVRPLLPSELSRWLPG
jgi:membrane protein required for colicin V production